MIENLQNTQTSNSETENLKQDSASNFEAVVLDAATRHAQKILQDAKEEGTKEYEALIKNDKADVVAAHKTEIEASLRRKVASEKQENMKKLLVYRKQLVNGLFAQCKESLEQFAATQEYISFCINCIAKHIKNDGANHTVLLKQEDTLPIEQIQKQWPAALLQTDSSIKIGGVKVRYNNILYNETLDRRLEDERELFVQRSNLHVSAQETEIDNEQ